MLTRAGTGAPDVSLWAAGADFTHGRGSQQWEGPGVLGTKAEETETTAASPEANTQGLAARPPPLGAGQSGAAGPATRAEAETVSREGRAAQRAPGRPRLCAGSSAAVGWLPRSGLASTGPGVRDKSSEPVFLGM